MDNVEDMDGFEIDTGKYIYIYIYICSFYLLHASVVYLFGQCLRIIFFNGIVEIKAVCPMTMEEDPITVVLDNDERSAALCLELVSS